MESLYEKNGLVFWTQEEIKLRRFVEEYFLGIVSQSLKQQNPAFNFIQVEAPLFTPKEFINKNYTDQDIYSFDDIALRPETTMGSYVYAKNLLSGYNDIKYKPPIVVWQHGKSFRKEQDQPTKFMRLKEFYQLEFQIIYGINTANDYSIKLFEDVLKGFNKLLGMCNLEESDRLPNYSEQTMDIVFKTSSNNMEVCSMSKRKDFENYKVIEVAIGSDRVVHLFNTVINKFPIKHELQNFEE